MEGTGGRARSGGNSAINTNIFRSVLQPCFDNHPHQARSRVPSPLCDSYQAAPSRNPSRFLLGLPARVRPACLATPSDLKYVDTLTHTTERAVPHAYTKKGDVSHPLRLTYQVPPPLPPSALPRGRFPFSLPSRHLLIPFVLSAYSSTRFDIFRELRPARTSRKSILR